MLAVAIKDDRFEIPADVLRAAPAAMQKIIENPESTQREIVSASRVIVAMVNSNRSAEVKQVVVTHDITPEAAATLDQRRAKLIEAVDRIG